MYVVVSHHWEQADDHFYQPEYSPGYPLSVYRTKEHAEKIARYLQARRIKSILYSGDSLLDFDSERTGDELFTDATKSLMAKHGVSHLIPEGTEDFDNDIQPKIFAALCVKKGPTLLESTWNEELTENFACSLQHDFYSVNEVSMYDEYPSKEGLARDDRECLAHFKSEGT